MGAWDAGTLDALAPAEEDQGLIGPDTVESRRFWVGGRALSRNNALQSSNALLSPYMFSLYQHSFILDTSPEHLRDLVTGCENHAGRQGLLHLTPCCPAETVASWWPETKCLCTQIA